MKPLNKGILHIGCEKTGTSSIQRFLSMNRPSLKKQGFIYPVAGGTLYGGSQTGYAVVARKEAWLTDMGKALGLLTPGAVTEYRQQLAAQLQIEISRVRRGHTLVLSSEHFHSRLRSAEEIAALRSFLEPFCESFEVVMYFRRQDRVAVSLYATHVKSGNPSPKPFLPAIELPETYYYRYDEIFQSWAQVFGAESLRAGIYQPDELLGGDLLQDFCHRSGIPFEGKKIPEAQNMSLSPEAAQFLLEVNRQMRAGELAMESVDRNLLIREIERLFPGKVFPFDRQTALEFYSRFWECNANLQVQAFPGRTTLLFEEDFSEYPDVVQSSTDPFPHSVKIALQLAQSVLDGSSSLISGRKI